MAYDNVLTQYRVHGSASAADWAMLGLTLVSVGLFATAGITGKFAARAKLAGRTNTALKYERIASVATTTNVGIGGVFSGYAGVEAYKAFQKGLIADGWFLTGLAAFPWAPILPKSIKLAGKGVRWTGGKAWTFVGSRFKARAMRNEVLGETVPTPEVTAPKPVMSEAARWRKVLSTPEGLYRFLKLHRAKTPANQKKALARLPADIRVQVEALVGPGKKNAATFAMDNNVKAGNLRSEASLAYRLLGDSIKTF
jgi:hypothetical protein